VIPHGTRVPVAVRLVENRYTPLPLPDLYYTGTGVTAVAGCAGETVTLACSSTKRLGVDWRYHSTATSDGSYVVASGYVQWKYRHRYEAGSARLCVLPVLQMT